MNLPWPIKSLYFQRLIEILPKFSTSSISLIFVFECWVSSNEPISSRYFSIWRSKAKYWKLFSMTNADEFLSTNQNAEYFKLREMKNWPEDEARIQFLCSELRKTMQFRNLMTHNLGKSGVWVILYDLSIMWADFDIEIQEKEVQMSFLMITKFSFGLILHKSFGKWLNFVRGRRPWNLEHWF